MVTNISRQFPRTRPEQEGVASSTLLQFLEALENQVHELHSVLILRHGKVVAEGWWSPYRREYPHSLFSVSKSFTATAIGLALAEGRFSSDDPVLSFFPDETPADASDFLASMHVRHLLTMSTGHTSDPWSNMVDQADGNWIRGFLSQPILHAPGSHFLYNTGATYMLSAIAQKTTGMKLMDYLRPRLFEPLGIENATWQESPQGIAVGGYGLSAKTEDIARLGQLYLQKGVWGGRRILPEDWVNAATSIQVSNGNSAAQSDWTQGYGYQFWRCRHGAYAACGVFGQYCIVMPEQDAVLAVTGGIDLFEGQQLLNLVWEKLLPALGNEPLAEDTTFHDALVKKISTLALAPVDGQAATAILSQVSGRTYEFDSNELSIETISLSFGKAGCSVKVKTAAGDDAFPCGYKVWQQGHTTSLFNKRWLPEAPLPSVASGAWTAEDCFTMIVRFHETPFFQTLVYHFAGDELLLETWVNATIDVPKHILLTAHSKSSVSLRSP